MADNPSTQAKHLIELDVGIAKGLSSLQELSQQIKEVADSVPKYWNNSMNEIEKTDFLKKIGISDESISDARQKLEKLSEQMGAFSKIQITTKDGNLFEAIIEQADKAGKSIKTVIDLTQALGQFEAKDFGSVIKKTTFSEDFGKELDVTRKSLDGYFKELEKIDSESYKFAEKQLEYARKQKEAQEQKEGSITETEITRLKEMSDSYDSAVKKVNSLGLAYEELIKKVRSSNISDENATYIQNMANRSLVEIDKIKDYLAQGMTANLPTEQITVFEKVLETLTGELEKATQATKNFESANNQISRLTNQYAEFQNTLSRSKLDDAIGTPLANIKNRAASARVELEQISTTIKNSGTVTKEQAQRIQELDSTLENLKRELKDADTQARETGTGFKQVGEGAKAAGGFVADFISKLSDKAKWLVAFQFITLIQNSFREVVSTIKDTEDAVIELQRVLNDDSLANSTISDELYDIAYRYGQTFENVQETAVLFAQTGKSWNEVLQATEATMLGLNTAELDVTLATQGLIAVMSQFKIPASELQEIIDKINITADNFPVTSEKIVTALQRAGGTASAFNMTIEETIGVITALAESTGRSGQNIGTSLNSLITFTAKASNLKLFAGLSSEMEETVKKFQSGAGSIIDVWEQLSIEIKRLSKEQQDALYSSTAYEEFADAFEAEAAEYAASIQEIYGSAGAYRRNYLTALLNDMGTVEDVMSNLADAEGYSLSENEKYMQSLTSQLNQLKVAAKELAVQFSQDDFLDFLKFTVQASTGVLKLTKDLGGLKTVLLALITLFTLIKREQIGKKITSVLSSITNLKGGIGGLISQLSIANAYQIAYNASLEQSKIKAKEAGIAYDEMKAKAVAASAGMSAALGTVLGWFSLLITGINAIKSLWDSYKEKQKEALQETITLGDEAKEKIDSLYDSYKKLSDAQSSDNVENQTKAQNELLKALGYTNTAIKNLSGSYDELNKKVEEATEKEFQYAKAKAILAAQAAEEDIKNIEFDKIGQSRFTEFFKPISEYLGTDNVSSIQKFINWLDKIPQSSKEAGEKLYALTKIQEEFLNNMTTDELKGNSLFKQIGIEIDAIQPKLDKVKETSGSLLLDERAVSWETYYKLREEIEQTGKSMDNSSDSSSNFKINLEKVEEEIKNINTAMDELNGKMDSFQSAYKTLESTIEEYNKTGILTADMMQDLLKLDPQYLEMLELKNGKLELNKEKVDELIAVNDDYMTQLAALNVLEEYNNLLLDEKAAKEKMVTLEDYRRKFAMVGADAALVELIAKYQKGEVSQADFRDRLKEIATESGVAAENIEYFAETITNLTGAYSNFLNLGGFKPIGGELTKASVEAITGQKVLSRKGFTDKEYKEYLQSVLDEYYEQDKNREDYWFGGSTKSSKDKFDQQLKDMKTEYQKWIKLLEGDLYLAQEKNAPTDVIVNIYKKMQQEIHEAANQYRDLGLDDNNEYIIELKKQWWKYQDEIDKLYANDYNKFKEEQENKLSLLKNQYNVLESNLDETGKSTNLQEQADTYKKIMEAAHNEAERLRADGVEKNKDAIQKAIDDWWKAYDSWKEINNKIATNVFDSFEDIISLADSLNVWDKLDFTKVDLLKDKLEAINNLFNEGKLEASDYKDALKDVGIALYNAEIERLKKLGEDAETQNKADVEAINKNIEAIETLKKNSDDYYDGLIDNLKQVQEENQRVNDQLEYQNNRQKIITNLEQARARSGIEYRQKEMEYQQQLVDLDEEWRKKQEELNLTDQMEQLEALKKQAAEDFEKSIEQLNEQITRLNTGLEDTLEGLDKQAEELGKKIFDAINTGTKENLSEVGNQILFALDESQSPIKQKASVIGIDISNSMFGTQLENAAMTSATNVLNIFKTAFINPMDSAITQLMSKIMIPTSKDILSLGYGPINPNRVANNNSIIMYNNIPNVSAANSTIRGAQDIVKLNTNPSRF